MKATGRSWRLTAFEGSLLKAVRSLIRELTACTQGHNWSDPQLLSGLQKADDRRLFCIAEALRRGYPVDDVTKASGVDRWFIQKIHGIVELVSTLEERFRHTPLKPPLDDETKSLLRLAKSKGISDAHIARIAGMPEHEFRELRKQVVKPVYKTVDTCAAEFDASTPYFYSAYEDEDEVEATTASKVLVLGSGPIRIGQGIEFDYCSVHSVWGLKEAGVESVIINNNPETVSTDFDTSDRLYFEPLTIEDVLNVVDKEKPDGVIVQFGGQTAINLAGPLKQAEVSVLGTAVENIDLAEDRELFSELLRSIGIPKPRVGQPLILTRPSALRKDRLSSACQAFTCWAACDGNRLQHRRALQVHEIRYGGIAESPYTDRSLPEWQRGRGRRDI